MPFTGRATSATDDQQAARRVGVPVAVAQTIVQRLPRKRHRHVGGLGRLRHRELGLRHVEQHDVPAQRIERVALGVDLSRRDVPQQVALEAPQEQPDVRHVVSAARVVDVADFGEVRGLLERRVVQPDRRSRSNVDRELVRRTGMIHVLRGCGSLEELHGLASPAGDVARQLFEHGRRTLAPAVRQRVGDVASLAEGRLGARRTRRGARARRAGRRCRARPIRRRSR